MIHQATLENIKVEASLSIIDLNDLLVRKEARRSPGEFEFKIMKIFDVANKFQTTL